MEKVKEEKIHNMTAEWNYIHDMNYSISEEQYARYNSLYECVKCSSFYEEMDKYLNEFYALISEIRESQVVCENHMFEQIINAPTCYQNGEEINVCINCGYKEVIYIEKLPHEYGEDGSCLGCGNNRVENDDVVQFPTDGWTSVQ